MKLGDKEKEIEFLVDTGATYSVLNKALMPVGDDYIVVHGATGQSEKAYFFKPLKYKIGKQWGIRKFLYLPNSPKALLGRDLLEQLQATIIFRNGEVVLEINDQQYVEILSLILTTKDPVEEIREEIMEQVFPGVWATDVPGRAKNATPIQIKLKEERQPVRIKQYPLKREDREGIGPIIEKFLQLGLLKECQSDFNTPILPVRKPDGSYWVVQDLRAVNEITEDLYPVVANPYTLLTCLTPELTWFTVLDLKDAFFCLPLHEASQKILHSNGKALRVGAKPSSHGRCCLRDLRTAPPCLENSSQKT
uniref:Uncharacterized protein n=1 Tax=Corvus moneduloides TaxID=1196302 RepID=A0A8U7NQ83_CORMO